jgi:hypothetical protein
MKVTLPRGIASISGTISRSGEQQLVAKTFKRPDGTKETRMYWMARQQRTTPVSDREINARNRFAQMAQEVSRRIEAGDRRPRKIIWAEVKHTFQCPSNVLPLSDRLPE